jgi:endonuclease/exonuclease/phosphatase family metal-dependent hydrolase
LNAVAAMALLASYAALYIPPDKFWLMAVAGLLYPWVLSANLIIIIAWFIIQPRFIFISLLIILAGWNVLTRFIRLEMKENEDTTIKIVTYNVRYFMGAGNQPSREYADRIKNFLLEKEPDIICLQEVELKSNQIFNLEGTIKEMPSINHYQYARTSRRSGSVTMSRYPIINMKEVRFENSGNLAIYTDVVRETDTIRIFNVHLQSYRIDPDRYRIIETQIISNDEDLKEARELGSKYRRASKMRAVQARIIQRKIKESPYPVIVCGDFNDTPSSYAYQTMRGKLKDSFIESGRGIGQTYVGKLPSFRIDYILHSKFFRSYNSQVYNLPYSDHLPVVSDLVIGTE